MVVPSPFDISVWQLGIGLGLVVALVWLAAGAWAYRDMRRRSRSVGWATAALILVLVLPVAGLVIYMLLRPPETLTQRYDRTLQQEVLLQQIETMPICPGCARPVEAHWLVCPECHVTLRRPCGQCGEVLALDWQLCPACAHMVQQPLPPESVMAGG